MRMKNFNEEIKAYVSENGFKEESGFDKDTYSVIYQNGWYWNGITLTQSEYLFDKKPIITHNIRALVTEEWTHIKSQIGCLVPLKRSGLKIIKKTNIA